MAFSRVLGFCQASFFNKSNIFYKFELLRCSLNTNFNQERSYRKSLGTFMRIMKLRRRIAGPDRIRKRSEWLNWNYNAEIFAFNKRLGENVSDDTLRCVFVHDSYIKSEEVKRREMDIQDVQLNLKSNADLAKTGHDIMCNFLKKYLRMHYHLIPQEGIDSVHSFLMSDEVLSHVSSNLGTKDLIFCAEYPPNDKTSSETLKAFVGGIAKDDSISRAENFILDFVCPQLIGKDILELCNFERPLEILNNILTKQNRPLSESRLIFESGRNTIEAIYHVGIYSDKQFLGRGAGETLTFAEEMAAYDALRRIFCIKESENPLLLGEAARKSKLTASTHTPLQSSNIVQA